MDFNFKYTFKEDDVKYMNNRKYRERWNEIYHKLVMKVSDYGRKIISDYLVNVDMDIGDIFVLDDDCDVLDGYLEKIVIREIKIINGLENILDNKFYQDNDLYELLIRKGLDWIVIEISKDLDFYSGNSFRKNLNEKVVYSRWVVNNILVYNMLNGKFGESL